LNLDTSPASAGMMPSRVSETCYKKYQLFDMLGKQILGEWLCGKVLFTNIA